MTDAYAVSNNINQLFNSIITVINSGKDNILCFPISRAQEYWDDPIVLKPNEEIKNLKQCKGTISLKEKLLALIQDNVTVPAIISKIKDLISTSWYSEILKIIGDVSLTNYLFPKILAVVYYNKTGPLYINCYLNYPDNIDMTKITDTAHQSDYPARKTPKVDTYYDDYNYSCSIHDTLYNQQQQVALIVNELQSTGINPPISSIGSRFSTHTYMSRERYFPGVL